MSSSGDRVACVQSDRDSLWWEFPLESSFRWQAHTWGLAPAVYRRRLVRLVNALGLGGLLGVPVAHLTAEERALADLAVALLPGPAVLEWVEPGRGLGAQAGARVRRLLAGLARTEGLQVVTRPGGHAAPAQTRRPG